MCVRQRGWIIILHSVIWHSLKSSNGMRLCCCCCFMAPTLLKLCCEALKPSQTPLCRPWSLRLWAHTHMQLPVMRALVSLKVGINYPQAMETSPHAVSTNYISIRKTLQVLQSWPCRQGLKRWRASASGHLSVVDVHEDKAGCCILSHCSICSAGRSGVDEKAVFILISLQQKELTCHAL